MNKKCLHTRIASQARGTIAGHIHLLSISRFLHCTSLNGMADMKENAKKEERNNDKQMN